RLLATARDRVPDKPAVIAGEQAPTYRQLDDLSTRLAARWLADGLEDGDRVATLLGNGIELVLIYLAGFKSGMVVVPLAHTYESAQIAYALRHSGSRLVILQADKQADLPNIIGREGLESGYVVGGPVIKGLHP